MELRGRRNKQVITESGESSLMHVRGRNRNDVLADQVVRCDPSCSNQSDCWTAA
jgi:hypothetical protein